MTLRRTLSLLLTTLVAVGLLAACSDDGTEVTAGNEGDATGERRLVLRMEVAGGFLPIEEAFRSVPAVSVYSDGLVVSQGVQIAIYPPPALPALVESHLSDDELDDLLADARDSGVFDVDDFGQPPVADAGSTIFTLRVDGELETATVNALGLEDGGGLSPDQQEARRKAQALQQRMGELPGQAGEELWHAERVAVLVTGEAGEGETGEGEAGDADTGDADGDTPRAQDGEPGTTDPETTEETLDPDTTVSSPVQDGDTRPVDPEFGNTADWPGPSLDTFGEEGDGWPERCGVLSGDDAEAVLEAAAQASTLTRWRSAGTEWIVTLRPALPDEHTCEDMAVVAVGGI